MKACNQCGKCCISYSDGGLSASSEDLEWWGSYRPDIAKYVKKGKIWIDPVTGEQLNRCPWLRHDAGNKVYTCDIYHDRPEDCRHYPINIDQMLKDNCEMLETRDLKNAPEAQKALDKLMSDSRPSG